MFITNANWKKIFLVLLLFIATIPLVAEPQAQVVVIDAPVNHPVKKLLIPKFEQRLNFSNDFYLSQPTVNELKAIMKGFLSWTQKDGTHVVWDSWQKLVDSGIYQSFAYFPDSTVIAAFESVLSKKINDWLSEQHEVHLKHLSIEENACCNIVYGCVVKAFVSAANFLDGNEKGTSAERVQLFISRVHTIIQEFIIPALEASAERRIDNNTLNLCTHYLTFTAAMLGKNIARCEELFGLCEYLDELGISRGPASGLIVCKESTIRFHQIDILQREIDRFFSSCSTMSPILHQTHFKLMELCKEFRVAWHERDERGMWGKVMSPIAPKFENIYAFSDAYKDVLKDGFYRLLQK